MSQSSDSAQYQYVSGAKGSLSGWDLDSTNPNLNTSDIAGYSIKQLMEELRSAINDSSVSTKLSTLLTLLQNHVSDTNNPHRDSAASMAADIASTYMGSLYRGKLPSALPVTALCPRTHFYSGHVGSRAVYNYTSPGSNDVASLITVTSNNNPSGMALNSVPAGDLPVSFNSYGKAGTVLLSQISYLSTNTPSYSSVFSNGALINNTTGAVYATQSTASSPTTNATLSLYSWLVGMTSYVSVYVTLTSLSDNTSIVMRYTGNQAVDNQVGAFIILQDAPNHFVPVYTPGIPYPVLFRIPQPNPGYQFRVAISLNNPMNDDGSINTTGTDNTTALLQAVPGMANNCKLVVYDNAIDYLDSSSLLAITDTNPVVSEKIMGNAYITTGPAINLQNNWGLGLDIELPYSCSPSGTYTTYPTGVYSSTGIKITASRVKDTNGQSVYSWNVSISDRIGVVVSTVITGTTGRLALSANPTQILIRAAGNENTQVFPVVARAVDLGNIVIGPAQSPSQIMKFISMSLYHTGFDESQIEFLSGGSGA